jgi:branched-subunit amino acid aminotransferase/4-amino-4-deoxychorismate lyase
VLWWEDGRLCAPALDLGVLPGVGRARLAELAGEVEERHSRLDDLEGRPVFLVNSVRGVIPVASLDGQQVVESKETDTLAARFWR